MELDFTLKNIRDVAGIIWEHAGDGKVIAFHGEMGAGKTTLIHALCDLKGVTDAVGSPTFSLINEYEYPEKNLSSTTTKRLYHIDLYRIKNEEEAIRAGIEDILYSGNPCLVEWPEKAPDIFPDDTIHLNIQVVDNDHRRVIIADN